VTVSRVAICFGTFPPERNGGSDFVAQFAPALAAAGSEVHVLTSPAAGAPAVEHREPGVTVHRIVDDWSWPGGRAGLKRVDDRLREVDAQIVHVLFPDSVIGGRYQLAPRIGRAARLPLVTTFWSLGLGRRSPQPLRRAAIQLLARSKVISSHDPSYLAALERLVLRRKPVHWLPVGSNFGPAERRRVDGPMTLGFFGQLDFTRGVDTLFEALALLGRPELKLVMLGSAGRPERYGDDPEFRRLLALPGALGVAGQVEWTGYLSDAEVPQRLADLDLCVLPYRRNSLGRSALAAAFAVGAPVVLAGRPDRIEPLVAGRNIALVPPDDPAELAAELGRLLDDPDARRRLSDGAKDAAQLFSWDRIAQDALALYEEALS
jgi:glycosyltransferase involved in cell wall biosynthesis